ncbi:chlorophyllase-2-like isoform X1 [Nicotiana tomentosiformis]|uniref:chlorophyllase-2-like isoform X1 n=2 Tax=Nicotiana tomentosiformis TaxID=4098 RepID=UPI0008782ECB|nr:chlorophyllase-2, chloroplastic-like isoform X1 [Nicotiana tomentosiformis]
MQQKHREREREMAKKVGDDGIALDFQVGDEAVEIINVKRSFLFDLLPCPLLVFSPTTQGSYPVLLFFHGFMLQPNSYKSLLLHISSHQYIIVAPQFSPMASQSREVKNARKIVEWLSTNNLDSVLPEKVFPDLQKVAVSGHSSGGKTAFALALGYGGSSTSNATQLEPGLKISALLGIDPVAGSSTSCLCSPNILQFIPYSFDQSIPVAVIGGGLSNQRALGMCPPGAPNGVNHAEFFNESKPPCYYFLAKDYGHLDMLDDGTASLSRWMMKSGKGSTDTMRRTVGGLFVAFLKAYLEGQADDLINIVESPNIRAPITLDPVISIEE